MQQGSWRLPPWSCDTSEALSISGWKSAEKAAPAEHRSAPIYILRACMSLTRGRGNHWRMESVIIGSIFIFSTDVGYIIATVQ